MTSESPSIGREEVVLIRARDRDVAQRLAPWVRKDGLLRQTGLSFHMLSFCLFSYKFVLVTLLSSRRKEEKLSRLLAQSANYPFSLFSLSSIFSFDVDQDEHSTKH